MNNLDSRRVMELESLMDREDGHMKLMQRLKSDQLSSRKEALELLIAAPEVSLTNGVNFIIKTLDAWKTATSKRYRFQPLLNLLTEQSNDFDQSLLILKLLNSLLVSTSDISDRVRLRNELIGLKLQQTMDSLRSQHSSDESGSELMEEMDSFDKLAEGDSSALAEAMKNVDLGSPTDVFYAILKQVTNSPQEMQFLTLLQHLLQLDPKEEVSDIVWELAEKLVCKAKLVENREEANRLLRLHASKSLSNLQDMKRNGTLTSPCGSSVGGSRKGENGRCCCSCHFDPGGRPRKSDPDLLTSHKRTPSTSSTGSTSAPPPPPPISKMASLSSSSPPPPPILPLLSRQDSNPSPPPPPAPPLPIGGLKLANSPVNAPPPPGPAPGTFAALIQNRSKQVVDEGGVKATTTIPSRAAPPAPKMDSSFHAETAKLTQLQSGNVTPNAALKATPSLLAANLFPQVAVPKSKLKNLPWNKVPVSKVVQDRDNIWAQAAQRLDKTAKAIDFDKLEAWFAHISESAASLSSHADDKTRHGSLERKKKGETNEINLLDPKRSLNVNIFLKQFRGGIDDLSKMIMEGHSEEVGLEKLKGLTKLLPELEEIETLNSYTGDRSRLGSAEQFFLALIKLSDYRLRIDCLLLREEFNSTIDYIKPSIELVLMAARSLKSNRRLQEVLSIVLAVGNYLNAGSYSGNAAGFKLTSLSKLVEIRANKPRANLLHYVALEAEKMDPDLLELRHDLKYLEEAQRLSVETIKQDITHLRHKTEKISKQVAQSTEEDILNQMNHFLDFAKEQLVGLQQDLNEVDRLRVELAHFFCEDIASFKLEECFKIFHMFIQRYSKAVEENNERKAQEEKEEKRKKLKEQQLIKRRSKAEPTTPTNCRPPTQLRLSLGPGLVSGGANLNDITLKHYFQDDTSSTPTLSTPGSPASSYLSTPTTGAPSSGSRTPKSGGYQSQWSTSSSTGGGTSSEVSRVTNKDTLLTFLLDSSEVSSPSSSSGGMTSARGDTSNCLDSPDGAANQALTRGSRFGSSNRRTGTGGGSNISGSSRRMKQGVASQSGVSGLKPNSQWATTNDRERDPSTGQSGGWRNRVKELLSAEGEGKTETDKTASSSGSIAPPNPIYAKTMEPSKKQVWSSGKGSGSESELAEQQKSTSQSSSSSDSTSTNQKSSNIGKSPTKTSIKVKNSHWPGNNNPLDEKQTLSPPSGKKPTNIFIVTTAKSNTSNSGEVDSSPDLDDILTNTLQQKQHGRVIGRRSRRRQGGLDPSYTIDADNVDHSKSNDQSNKINHISDQHNSESLVFNKNHTTDRSVDEVYAEAVEHCERSKVDIDQMIADQTIADQDQSTSDARSKSRIIDPDEHDSSDADQRSIDSLSITADQSTTSEPLSIEAHTEMFDVSWSSARSDPSLRDSGIEDTTSNGVSPVNLDLGSDQHASPSQDQDKTRVIPTAALGSLKISYTVSVDDGPADEVDEVDLEGADADYCSAEFTFTPVAPSVTSADYRLKSSGSEVTITDIITATPATAAFINLPPQINDTGIDSLANIEIEDMPIRKRMEAASEDCHYIASATDSPIDGGTGTDEGFDETRSNGSVNWSFTAEDEHVDHLAINERRSVSPVVEEPKSAATPIPPENDANHPTSVDSSSTAVKLRSNKSAARYLSGTESTIHRVEQQAKVNGSASNGVKNKSSPGMIKTSSAGRVAPNSRKPISISNGALSSTSNSGSRPQTVVRRFVNSISGANVIKTAAAGGKPSDTRNVKSNLTTKPPLTSKTTTPRSSQRATKIDLPALANKGATTTGGLRSVASGVVKRGPIPKGAINTSPSIASKVDRFGSKKLVDNPKVGRNVAENSANKNDAPSRKGSSVQEPNKLPLDDHHAKPGDIENGSNEISNKISTTNRQSPSNDTLTKTTRFSGARQSLKSTITNASSGKRQSLIGKDVAGKSNSSNLHSSAKLPNSDSPPIKNVQSKTSQSPTVIKKQAIDKRRERLLSPPKVSRPGSQPPRSRPSISASQDPQKPTPKTSTKVVITPSLPPSRSSSLSSSSSLSKAGRTFTTSVNRNRSGALNGGDSSNKSGPAGFGHSRPVNRNPFGPPAGSGGRNSGPSSSLSNNISASMRF